MDKKKEKKTKEYNKKHKHPGPRSLKPRPTTSLRKPMGKLLLKARVFFPLSPGIRGKGEEQRSKSNRFILSFLHQFTGDSMANLTPSLFSFSLFSMYLHGRLRSVVNLFVLVQQWHGLSFRLQPRRRLLFLSVLFRWKDWYFVIFL